MITPIYKALKPAYGSSSTVTTSISGRGGGGGGSGGGGEAGGGGQTFLQVCEKHSQATKKRWNACTVMVLLHICSKSLGVRLPVCPVNKNIVLILIKL